MQPITQVCQDQDPADEAALLDTAERSGAREALRQSEERFRALAENIEDVFYFVEGEIEKVLYVSPAYEQIWGRSREALYADPLDWTRSIHPEDRVRVLASVPTRNEGQNTNEYRIIRPDGSVRWIRDRVFPLAGAPGPVPQYTGIAQDITRERQDHERYRFLAEANAVFLASALDMRARLSLLAELCVPILADFCTVDIVQDGCIQRVAAAHSDPAKAPLVEALLRFPPLPDAPAGPAEAIRTGKSVLVDEVTAEVMDSAARDPEHRRLMEVLAPRAFLTVPLKARDQILGAISFALSSSGREFGELDRALSEELASHAALAIDNARLYEAMRTAAGARQEILNVVSHELRAPLHAVALISDTLRQSLPTSGQTAEQERVQTIGRLSEQMTRMVDDLVDVTQIEAGRFRVSTRPEEIRRILDEARQSVELIARGAGIDLSVRSADSLGWVSADRQRTLQVITNLVTNAIRVTPRGATIALEAEAVGGEVRVSVLDGGFGIATKDMPRLFDRFWRGSGASSRGMGLGLPIAKGIVQAQGGRIWAENRARPQRGAAFHFTIPALKLDQESRFEGAFSHYSAVEEALVTKHTPEGRSASKQEDADARLLRFASEMGGCSTESADDAASLTNILRRRILARVCTGGLRVGDRLPSIRQLAGLMHVPIRAAVSAYARLEREGVLESRARSGVYVAGLERACWEPPTETARWMVEVLAEASDHQIRLPYLPELFRRWTSAVPLRCACIESDIDSISTLQGELEHRFGLGAIGVNVGSIPSVPYRTGADPGRLPESLTESDILVTTPMHAPVVRRWADVLDKPLVVAAIHPAITESIRRQLVRGDLTAMCVDPAFGERLRQLFGGMGVGRVRVICLADYPQVETMSAQERVLLTWAAREQLGHSELPLLVPVSPAFAPEFTLHLSRVIIRLNLQRGRK